MDFGRSNEKEDRAPVPVTIASKRKFQQMQVLMLTRVAQALSSTQLLKDRIVSSFSSGRLWGPIRQQDEL